MSAAYPALDRFQALRLGSDVMSSLAWPELCGRLSELRARHDPPLTQRQAADLIGLSVRQYGRLERGQANATLATIRKIAAAYEVDPQLLTGTPAAPAVTDLARVERKLELLLEHFGLSADDGAGHLEDAAAAVNGREHAHAAPARQRRVAGRTRGA
jgi:transcriptional regulator with XRE-family HTH domain